MRYANYIVASLALTLVERLFGFWRLLYLLHGRRVGCSPRCFDWADRNIGGPAGRHSNVWIAPCSLLSADTNMAIDNS